ncbi:MAG: GTPase ObgE [Anaerolineae bacterium]
MFLDEAEVDVKAGNGGNGIVAFRREKFVPRGGPAGGNGGKGGDVIFVADEGVNTLHAFRFTKRYEAARGGHGGGSNKRGKDGADLRVVVPAGTIVREAAGGAVLGDLVAHGQELVVAKGGRGGRGNAAFKSPTQQAPRYAEKGEPGEERRLALELRLLADVGIIGLPNAGKSTLLSRISAARPRIADYPFTTLVPNLGVAEIGDDALVFADIPGLIEGASEGAGLGDQFLRHVERTRLLVHLVDGSAADPKGDFAIINGELAAFSASLADRPQIVVVTKTDLPATQERLAGLKTALRAASGGAAVRSISGLTGEGVGDLLYAVLDLYERLPPVEAPEEELPVLRPLEADEDAFDVSRIDDGEYRVTGVRVERAAAMTDWGNDAAIARFQRILEAIGVTEALREAGVGEGDAVAIGDYQLEWYD